MSEYVAKSDARIVKDSISPDGVRLTTMQITLARIVLAEFNTHRVFSRNSASSRAIPVEKMLERVQATPYVPRAWGKNQKGMQADEDLTPGESAAATDVWLRARDNAKVSAQSLLRIGVHKQLANRLLEPWLWHTIIVTSTEWSNFFHLRNNAMAHPDIAATAALMFQAINASKPTSIGYGAWHLPLINDGEVFEGDIGIEGIKKISAARCARVSYLTHNGVRDQAEDLKLYDRLVGPGHMSPLEHVARPISVDEERGCWYRTGEIDGRGNPREEYKIGAEHTWVGNFRGWFQHRKEIPAEADIMRPTDAGIHGDALFRASVRT